MKYLLALILLLATTPAWADTWISASLGSYHFDRSVDHQEHNWGWGLEQSITPTIDFVLGSYNNSIYDRSHYIGIDYLPLQYNGVKLGVVTGMVDGYKANNGNYAPMIAPIVEYEYKRVGFNLLFIPPLEGASGLIGFQVKFKIVD